jgi:CRP/FNR family transcriptional regulator
LEVLEVVDNIAFRAMDERLEFYLKRHADACGCRDLKNFHHQDIATELNNQRVYFSFVKKNGTTRNGITSPHRTFK